MGELNSGDSRVMGFLGVRGARAGDEPYLDGLRACAVLMVVVFHSYGLARTYGSFRVGGFDYEFIVSRTHLGVDLFFILSGFLLARPWFAAGPDQRPRVLPFLRRRIARIVPAYYLSLVLVLAVFGALDMIPRAVLVGWNGVVNIGSHLLFLQAYVPIASSAFNRSNGVWWSLTVEMTWYLVLPIFVLGFLGRRWRVWLPVSLIVAVGWTWLWNLYADAPVSALARLIDPATMVLTGLSPDPVQTVRWIFDSSLVGFAWTFALGVMLAKIHVSRLGKDPLITSGALAALGLLIAIGVFLAADFWSRNPPAHNMFRQIFALALAMVVFVIANGPRGLRRPLEFVPLRVLGVVSYGIFLVHVPIVLFVLHQKWFASWGAPAALVGISVVVLLISTVLAVASWMLVERPFLVSKSRQPQETRSWLRIESRAVVAALMVVAVGSYVIATRPTAVEREWSTVAEATSDAGLTPLFQFVPDSSPLLDKSGPMTAQRAFVQGIIDDELHILLASCRRKDAPGSVYSVVDHLTGAHAQASVFACASSDDAKRVIDGTRRNQVAYGQHRDAVFEISSVSVVRGLSGTDSNTTPDRTQIRYQSGFQVVTIDVTASDALTSAEVATGLWYFARRTFPAF